MKLIDQPYDRKYWGDIFPDNTIPVRAKSKWFKHHKLSFYTAITKDSFKVYLNGGSNHDIVNGYLIDGEFYHQDHFKRGDTLHTSLFEFTIEHIKLPDSGRRIIRTMYYTDQIDIKNRNGKLYLTVDLPEKDYDTFDEGTSFCDIEILDVKFNDITLDDYDLWKHLIEFGFIKIDRD